MSESVNGVLIIDKAKGYTSHDVVNVVRKVYGTRKVGHTGTLDPDATGVLPICIGKATKLCDMITFSDKEYVAKVRLGVVTDTQDLSGQVLSTCDVNVPKEELISAVNGFIGEIMQIPPMYSALKVGGKKLCDLARKGIEVERKPRPVTIYKAEVSNFDGREFDISVRCSKGTYIRTLCHDIGQTLGCGAAIVELRRTASSVFSIDDAITIDKLKELGESGNHLSLLIGVDEVLQDYEKLTITETVQRKICNGATAFVDAHPGTYRIYDKLGSFLCVADVTKDEENKKNVMKMTKAFF